MSRPSIQYQDGMELRDRRMTKDCTQPLRIGNIRALNGCAGRLFGAATLHNHKNSANKSNRKAMNRNWNTVTLKCEIKIDTAKSNLTEMRNQSKIYNYTLNLFHLSIIMKKIILNQEI